MGDDKIIVRGNSSSNQNYTQTPEYQKLKQEHPNSVIRYNEENNSISWSEQSGGIFNSSSSGGTVYLAGDSTTQSTSQQVSKILNDMDQYSLEKYQQQGFLIPKKDFLNGEYYVFDAKKYKEVTGKDITLGEIKTMLGLKDGVIRMMNEDVGFKDRGEGRDLDTAPIEEVSRSQKIKIPAKTLFQDDAKKHLGVY